MVSLEDNVKNYGHLSKMIIKSKMHLRNFEYQEGNHKKGTSIWLNEKRHDGTRVLLPGFESEVAFEKFMLLLSKRFGGSEKARIIQLAIQNDLPKTSDLGKFQILINNSNQKKSKSKNCINLADSNFYFDLFETCKIFQQLNWQGFVFFVKNSGRSDYFIF